MLAQLQHCTRLQRITCSNISGSHGMQQLRLRAGKLPQLTSMAVQLHITGEADVAMSLLAQLLFVCQLSINDQRTTAAAMQASLCDYLAVTQQGWQMVQRLAPTAPKRFPRALEPMGAITHLKLDSMAATSKTRAGRHALAHSIGRMTQLEHLHLPNTTDADVVASLSQLCKLTHLSTGADQSEPESALSAAALPDLGAALLCMTEWQQCSVCSIEGGWDALHPWCNASETGWVGDAQRLT